MNKKEQPIPVPEGSDEDQSTEPGIEHVLAPEPTIPGGITEEEALEIRSHATELINTLSEASGSQELEVADGISNVGAVTRNAASGQLVLLRTRLGTMLDAGGPSKEIANGLRDLRNSLKEITPDDASEPGIARRVVSAIPLVGGRYNPVLRTLNRIAIRYEPVAKQVALIETQLMDGRTLLVRDNLELRKLYEEVEIQQRQVRREAYLGEMLMRELAALIECTDDEVKRGRLQNTLHDVAMRTQDQRTMEQVYLQAFVSIEMGRQNNNRLGQAVERTVSLATNVVTVGLAIQSALIRQKRVYEATAKTGEFLGDLVAINAKAINQHTEEIGDLYNRPVIAIEKLTQAHDDLVEALNTAGQLSSEGIEAARVNIARLAEMSSQLDEKVSVLRGSTDPQTPQIETPRR